MVANSQQKLRQNIASIEDELHDHHTDIEALKKREHQIDEIQIRKLSDSITADYDARFRDTIANIRTTIKNTLSKDLSAELKFNFNLIEQGFNAKLSQMQQDI